MKLALLASGVAIVGAAALVYLSHRFIDQPIREHAREGISLIEAELAREAQQT